MLLSWQRGMRARRSNSRTRALHGARPRPR